MKVDEFDDLMQQFRQAGAEAAQREQAAASPSPRLSVAIAGDLRLRWHMPALAALVLLALGTGWAVRESRHPGHRHDIATHTSTAPATPSASLSDEALLNAVQTDLSSGVPQALEPLAVTYTRSQSARTGQKEMQ